MPDNYTEFVKDRRENKTVAVDNMFAVGGCDGYGGGCGCDFINKDYILPILP